MAGFTPPGSLALDEGLFFQTVRLKDEPATASLLST
jgi:hypothetical protein